MQVTKDGLSGSLNSGVGLKIPRLPFSDISQLLKWSDIGSLNLSGAFVSERHLAVFADAAWPFLKHLDLSRNQLDTLPVRHLARTKLPQLTTLILASVELRSSVHGFCSVLRSGKWGSLAYLDISYNALDSTALADLATADWSLRTLIVKKSLTFGTDWHPEHIPSNMQGLASGYFNRLQKIDLSDNKIADEFHLLNHAGPLQLEHLVLGGNMSGCRIGAEILSQAAGLLQHLHHLELVGSLYTLDQVIAIAVLPWKGLQILSADCSALTPVQSTLTLSPHTLKLMLTTVHTPAVIASLGKCAWPIKSLTIHDALGCVISSGQIFQGAFWLTSLTMVTSIWCDFTKNNLHKGRAFSSICAAFAQLNMPLVEDLMLVSPCLDSSHMELVAEGNWPRLSRIGFSGPQNLSSHSKFAKFGVLVKGNWPVLKTVVLSSFLAKHEKFQTNVGSQLACLRDKWPFVNLVYTWL